VAFVVEQVRAIEQELAKFDPELLAKPRWLVLNKADLLPDDEREARVRAIIDALGWTAPWFAVAAISKDGTWPICQQAMVTAGIPARGRGGERGRGRSRAGGPVLSRPCERPRT
jgi:GTPase involved in cell partitioning and DNA repair